MSKAPCITEVYTEDNYSLCVLDRKFTGRMKYHVLVVISALMAAHLQTSEDPLLPVGALVETMRNYCGSAFAKVYSIADLYLLSRCQL